MGRIYTTGSAYSASASSSAGLQGWANTTDAYVYSSGHIGHYRFGASSSSTSPRSSSTLNIAQAAGLTFMTDSTITGQAIEWTDTRAYIYARDSMSGGTITVGLSTNTTARGVAIPTGNLGGQAAFSGGGTGWKSWNISSVFNNANMTIGFMTRTSPYYLWLKSSGITGTRRFDRLANRPTTSLYATGTFKEPTIASLTVNKAWGATQTVSLGAYDNAYGLGNNQYVYQITGDSDWTTKSVSETISITGLSAGVSKTIYVKPTFDSNPSGANPYYVDSTGTRMYGPELTATVTGYGNKPSITLTVDTTKTTTNSITVSIKYNNTENDKLVPNSRYISINGGSTWIALADTTNTIEYTFNNLTMNTTYTIVARATINTGYPEENTLIVGSVTETTLNYTACGAPTNVSVAYSGKGKIKVTWSGASSGTNNTINAYSVILSTSHGGTAAHGQVVNTTSTSGSYEFMIGNNTTAYYAAVRTQGTAGSEYYSAYKWSSNTASSLNKPSVSVGETIKKTQMDTLKGYLLQGNTVTQNSTITATDGNSYKPNTVTQNITAITANWYNNE